MLATMEIVDVLDRSESIGKMVMESEVMQNYQQAKLDLESNAGAQKLIRDFNNMKEQYEDVQRFGRYHPDYNNIMKSVRGVKREMDMHETVAHYKKAEREVQKLLDEISQSVAFSVSEQIKVPRNGMVFTDSGCGCGSGGGCGCAS
ncbi:YlbF family regulator [Halobacillus shinanisalinarum]|uniref:YlbF family regulator n=1 Tax=Halobacillus shinanisalinarum TaxID=2932258 RepID=A0ABY4GYH0_9BACI|nr:YlbF family regulator [Halobacillus shinanisalinarum]UOQ93061.1 YlbF family regulator [Halobacillus shinanisalinarum]